MTQTGETRLSIVFDLGGVLIDWNPRYLYKKLFPGDDEQMEQFLSAVCSPEWNAKQDAGRPFSEAVAELVTLHPSREQLIRAFDARWEEMVAGPIQPSVDILIELKEAGYPLYALSNWSVEKFASMRDRFAFLGLFQTIVISGEARLIKPDPKIYSLLLRTINRAAEECLFIDDAIANIEVARDMGFKTIHFQSPDQLRRKLCRLAILDEEPARR